MFKKLFFFILFIIPSFVFAEVNEDRPTIEKITYSGYLSDDTLVEIIGNNIGNCNSIKLNNSPIIIESQSENKITYFISNNDEKKGVIDLKCDSYYASKSFVFPYIDSINGNLNSSTRSYEITGTNFTNSSSVNFESGNTIASNKITSSLIIGEVKGKISDGNIYISDNGVKSNLFYVDFKSPYINFIEAKNGFKGGEEVIIHGKNLDHFSKSYINFGDKIINNFNYDSKNSIISFILPDHYGLVVISINSNGIISNSLELNIIGKAPVIDDINLIGEKREVNDILEYSENLVLSGDFIGYKGANIKIYSNNKEIKVLSFDNKKITLKEFNLDIGNNYIYIDINGTHSNIVSYKNEINTPSISYIEPLSGTDNLRSFKIGLINFDKNNDIIYFNNGVITPYSCLSTSCIIKMNNSILRGSFSVGRGSNKSLATRFDISFGKRPIINDIIFYGDLKSLTKFKITGENIINSEISLSNLVDIDDNNRYEIDRKGDTIEGRLLKNYDINGITSIQVRKNGLSSSLNFKGTDIVGNRLIGAGIINNISSNSNDEIFTIGSEVNISGRGFKKDDLIQIGGKEVKLNFKSAILSSFTIPDNITLGEHKLNIITAGGQVGNSIDLLILENNKKNIELKNTDSKIDNYFTSTIYNDNLIYDFILKNNITDIYIKELKFKISNYNKVNNLGLFSLKIDGVVIGDSLINDSGYIIFNNILLDKKWLDYKISLVKKSMFLNKGNYDISLSNIDGYITGTSKKLNNFDFSNLKSGRILVFNKKNDSCIDSKEDKSNCNSSTSSSNTIIAKSNSTNTDTENKDNNITPSNNISAKQKIYNKIDSISVDYINQTSKLDLITQLNKYKNFRLKIKEIISKNKNSPNKEFLEYFYDIIDKKNKKVFKEYILSKK